MLLENTPTPTKNLHKARKDLDKYGFCLVPDALNAEEIATAQKRLLEQAEAEENLGLSFRDGGDKQEVKFKEGKIDKDSFSVANGGINQRLWMLVNKGECFRDMVIHPLVDELVGHILGQDFILSTHSANIAKPGGVRMGLHTDQWWMPQPVKAGESYIKPSEISRKADSSFIKPDLSLGISPPVVANCMWMLSDFSPINGSTEVVAGSHLTGAHPNQEDQSSYPIFQPTAEAGTLMVFDGRLWHGNGLNRSGAIRSNISTAFLQPWVKPQENHQYSIRDEVLSKITEKQKHILGFSPYGTLGGHDGSSVSPANFDPKRESIGILKP